ncbi:MAG: FxsA family protein [Acidimicrobiia bacterium]
MRFLAIFGLVALAEMATFFWVESQIGLLWALAIAATTAIVGSLLVRRAGLSVFGRIQQRTRQGQIPGRELSDGAAVLVAGAFLISPGFITDILGFLLLLPPVRDVIFRQFTRRFSARVAVFTTARPESDERWEPIGGEVIDVTGEDLE